MTDTEDIDLDNWGTEEKLDNNITVKVNTDNNPVLSAVFDGDELVSEPVSYMQHQEVIWFAHGYSDAKEEYGVSVEELGK